MMTALFCIRSTRALAKTVFPVRLVRAACQQSLIMSGSGGRFGFVFRRRAARLRCQPRLCWLEAHTKRAGKTVICRICRYLIRTQEQTA